MILMNAPIIQYFKMQFHHVLEASKHAFPKVMLAGVHRELILNINMVLFQCQT